MKKNVVILGSTGTLGKIMLEVIENNAKHFNIAGLTGFKNIKLLNQQAKKYRPLFGAHVNRKEIEKMVCEKKVDIVVVTCSGVTLIDAVLKAIRVGKQIAMANKEMIVENGPEIMKAVKKSKCVFVPVDSEHSGIFQCLQGHKRNDIEKVYLTCSGGPFLNLPKKDFKKITVEKALNHPVWKMGKKTTIDSATLMNKALEIIEAKYLFDLEPSQIEVLIHPQCMVHALVQFKDGNILAHFGYPDMKIPITYALFYPNIKSANLSRLNLINQKLEFYKPDTAKFPSINFAYEALKRGPGECKKLNRANQAAVNKFLNREIAFLDIFKIIGRTIF